MAKYEYPTGECFETTEYVSDKLGIYYIKYKTNKNLQHSIGGRRNNDKSLKWDLKDSEGYYTSIDIEDMRANGYQVEIVNGYYWESKGYIF